VAASRFVSLTAVRLVISTAMTLPGAVSVPTWWTARLQGRRLNRWRALCKTCWTRMPTKSLELPVKVAQAFARDMRAFFKAETQLEQDEIASRSSES
jgi:hypothetical protein